MQVNYHQPFLNVWEWKFNLLQMFGENISQMVLKNGDLPWYWYKKSPSTNPSINPSGKKSHQISKLQKATEKSYFSRVPRWGLQCRVPGTPPNDTQKEIRHDWGVINHILTTKFGKVEMNSVRGWACPLVMVRNDKGPN